MTVERRLKDAEAQNMSIQEHSIIALALLYIVNAQKTHESKNSSSHGLMWRKRNTGTEYRQRMYK